MRSTGVVISVVLCCAILFSLLTVFVQVSALGLPYLEKNQIARHRAVLKGTSWNPWQYRVLSEYLVEGVILLLTDLRFPRPVAGAFIMFRFFQNMLIFVLAAYYYKKLGLNTYVTLIGLSLLAWGMTHSLYDSDLQFNTYSDVIFFLSAGLVILYRKYVWVIAITGLAALNRETSGLIPVMLFADRMYLEPRNNESKKYVLVAAVALVLYVIVFFGLRYTYGNRPLFTSYGNRPGLGLLKYNVGRYVTWVQIFATMGILPAMAIFSIRRWPQPLKVFFLAIVPIWFILHLFAGVLAETRLLLVPHTMIFVPGALFGMQIGAEEEARDHSL